MSMLRPRHQGHVGAAKHRQATLLRRFGGDISSNTQAASGVRVGLATQPLINLMRDVLLESDLIYGDETTFQVQNEPGRRAQPKRYLWAQVNGSGPPVRMLSHSPGRGAQHAQRLSAGVKPGTVLMSGGYELYNGIAHNCQLVHLGRWARERGGFIKAEQIVQKETRSPELLATRFIALIGKLFAAEARSAKRKRTLAATAYAIQRRVLVIIERMMVKHLPGVVLSGLLGKALQYMRGQWPKLARYVENRASARFPSTLSPVHKPAPISTSRGLSAERLQPGAIRWGATTGGHRGDVVREVILQLSRSASAACMARTASSG